MKRSVVVLALMLAMAGCQSPPPRYASHCTFDGKPVEVGRTQKWCDGFVDVNAQCTAGTYQCRTCDGPDWSEAYTCTHW